MNYLVVITVVNRSKSLSLISVQKEVRLLLCFTELASLTKHCGTKHVFVSAYTLVRLSSTLVTIHVFGNSLIMDLHRPQGLISAWTTKKDQGLLSQIYFLAFSFFVPV